MIDFSEAELEAMWNAAEKMSNYFAKRNSADTNMAIIQYTQHLTKLSNRINKFFKDYFSTNPIYKDYAKATDVIQKEALKKRQNRLVNDMNEIIRIHKLIESLNYSEILKADNKNKVIVEKYDILQKMYDNFVIFGTNNSKLIKKISMIIRDNKVQRNRLTHDKKSTIDEFRAEINRSLNNTREAASSLSYILRGLNVMQDVVIKDVINDITVILGDYLYIGKKPTF
jgi:hypothetical protein